MPKQHPGSMIWALDACGKSPLLLAIGCWQTPTVCLNNEHAGLGWAGLLLRPQLGLNVQNAECSVLVLQGCFAWCASQMRQAGWSPRNPWSAHVVWHNFQLSSACTAECRGSHPGPPGLLAVPAWPEDHVSPHGAPGAECRRHCIRTGPAPPHKAGQLPWPAWQQGLRNQCPAGHQRRVPPKFHNWQVSGPHVLCRHANLQALCSSAGAHSTALPQTLAWHVRQGGPDAAAALGLASEGLRPCLHGPHWPGINNGRRLSRCAVLSQNSVAGEAVRHLHTQKGCPTRLLCDAVLAACLACETGAKRQLCHCRSLTRSWRLPCSVVASQVIAEEAALFKITVSFGSVTSLISLPCYMSHASIPAEVRAARGLPDDLVRISVGIEDVHDLLAGEPSDMCGRVLLCNGCLLEPKPS